MEDIPIMQVPVDIHFHHMSTSEVVVDHIKERVAKLDLLHDKLVSCRVVIDKPPHHRNELCWRVKVEVLVPPRHEMVATEDSGEVPGTNQELVHMVIGGAFDAIEKQLKKFIAKQRGEVKVHVPQRVGGTIDSIEEDHGFLRDSDDRIIYFHRNSVVGDVDFDKLTVGMRVDFAEEQGVKGPQARYISALAKANH